MEIGQLQGGSKCVANGISMNFGNTASSFAIQMSHNLLFIIIIVCILLCDMVFCSLTVNTTNTSNINQSNVVIYTGFI
jgi:hypothetical protein